METLIKVKKADVAALLDKTFPNYRGRKLKVAVASTVTLHNVNWGGGTRSQYKAVSLDATKSGTYEAPAPWAHTHEGLKVAIPQGVAIACHRIFCGVDTGITFYVRPDDMPTLITEETTQT